MKNIIDEIWENHFEFLDCEDSKAKDLLELSNGVLDQLEASLGDFQKQLLNEYVKYSNEYNEILEKQAFTNGFSAGSKLIAESFINFEKTTP